MEDYFYTTLNRNTEQAVRQNAAFFMGPNDSRIPPIFDSYSGQPITGANYFNLKLGNALNGKHYTEYVKVNEALSANIDWFATLPHESRPRGTLYREENASHHAAYSFVVPTAELNQNVYHENRHFVSNFAPFQSSNANMGSFHEFVHEQFSNAINASLTGCPFRNNIKPQEMEQFKAQLVNEISRNPAFMAIAANQARDEVWEFHRLPFDRHQFIERVRNESGPEFQQLNAAITDHIHDIHHNRRPSFNPEFNEMARSNGDIDGFVKKMIRQDKTAAILADTFAGTVIGKAINLVRTGKRIYAGVVLAGAIISEHQESHQHARSRR